MKKMKYLIVMFLCMLLIATSVPISGTNQMEASATKKPSVTPVIFVHGLWGGLGTFNLMIDSIFGLENRNLYCFDRLKYDPILTDENFADHCMNAKDGTIVKANQSIHQDKYNEWYPVKKKTITKNSVHYVPMQIIYDDYNPANQKIYLEKVLDDLSAEYQINKIFLVGHSMGGLGSWTFVENSRYSSKVTKMVSLTSPFFGTSAPHVIVNNYVDKMREQIKKASISKLNKSFRLLSIAGASDKEVPIMSSEFLCDEMKRKNPSKFPCQNITISAEHTTVHQKAITRDLVRQFLERDSYKLQAYSLYMEDNYKTYVDFNEYVSANKLKHTLQVTSMDYSPSADPLSIRITIRDSKGKVQKLVNLDKMKFHLFDRQRNHSDFWKDIYYVEEKFLK
jgi:uncharacterized alpha/beta hydrolase family protein